MRTQTIQRPRADLYIARNIGVEKAQDEMIEDGKLFFDGYGVRFRGKAQVDAYIEKQVARINQRRIKERKFTVEAIEIFCAETAGILVDIKPCEHEWKEGAFIRKCAKCTIEERLDSVLEKKRFCYYVLSDSFVEGKGFRPSVVFEGIAGHFPSGGNGVEPWYWGPTLKDAEEAAKVMNERLGISEVEALKIVASSMNAVEEKVSK